MTKPIKKTIHTPTNRTDADEAVGRIRELVIERESIKLGVELRKKIAEDSAAPRLVEIDAEVTKTVEGLEHWAIANPGEFGESKSVQLVHGKVGFRLGNWTLKTLKKAKWDDILERLKALKKTEFIRTKEEVDKEEILAQREALKDDGLRTLGLRASRDESFYVEPTLERPEPRRIEP
jgi:phage host-nuclease inhibitor protein Gam